MSTLKVPPGIVAATNHHDKPSLPHRHDDRIEISRTPMSDPEQPYRQPHLNRLIISRQLSRKLHPAQEALDALDAIRNADLILPDMIFPHSQRLYSIRGM